MPRSAPGPVGWAESQKMQLATWRTITLCDSSGPPARAVGMLGLEQRPLQALLDWPRRSRLLMRSATRASPRWPLALGRVLDAGTLWTRGTLGPQPRPDDRSRRCDRAPDLVERAGAVGAPPAPPNLFAVADECRVDHLVLLMVWHAKSLSPIGRERLLVCHYLVPPGAPQCPMAAGNGERRRRLGSGPSRAAREWISPVSTGSHQAQLSYRTPDAWSRTSLLSEKAR